VLLVRLEVEALDGPARSAVAGAAAEHVWHSGISRYSSTSTRAVPNRIAKVGTSSRHAQVTQLAMNPITTMPTPSRCGKSLRVNNSVHGQTRQRRRRGSPSPAVTGSPAAPAQAIAPAGTSTAAAHRGQTTVDARSTPSTATVESHVGQA